MLVVSLHYTGNTLTTEYRCCIIITVTITIVDRCYSLLQQNGSTYKRTYINLAKDIKAQKL